MSHVIWGKRAARSDWFRAFVSTGPRRRPFNTEGEARLACVGVGVYDEGGLIGQHASPNEIGELLGLRYEFLQFLGRARRIEYDADTRVVIGETLVGYARRAQNHLEFPVEDKRHRGRDNEHHGEGDEENQPPPLQQSRSYIEAHRPSQLTDKENAPFQARPRAKATEAVSGLSNPDDVRAWIRRPR